MRRGTALVLALAFLAFAPGCVTKKVKKALAKEVQASLTVSSDPGAVPPDLGALDKVKVSVETLETGITIIRIIGVYAEVVDAITWLIRQNLRLLANDDISRTLLEAALYALK
ncbi:MAG TPA: hypothetical protein VFY93_18845 [Planctomycetota bacterium]|nr:hypothetical protein [Planctomycetota bacterium]